MAVVCRRHLNEGDSSLTHVSLKSIESPPLHVDVLLTLFSHFGLLVLDEQNTVLNRFQYLFYVITFSHIHEHVVLPGSIQGLARLSGFLKTFDVSRQL